MGSAGKRAGEGMGAATAWPAPTSAEGIGA